MTRYVANPRRTFLRFERGMFDSLEAAGAALMRSWAEVDAPLTDAQWREIGRCNGRIYR